MRTLAFIFFISITVLGYGQKIYNPYDGLDLSKSYKAMLHGHTTESDGEMTPDDYISAYSDKGYSILSLTDHDLFYGTQDQTWTWQRWISETPSVQYIAGTDTTSAYFSDIDGNGEMFAIEGNEFSGIDHMQNWFTDLQWPTGYPTNQPSVIMDSMVARGGISQFNHPRAYARPVSYYTDLFDDYYGTIIGIEVFNKNNLYPDNGLWDSINSTRPCDSLIWGTSTDDQHGTFDGSRSNSTRHFMDTLTEVAMKANLRSGGFTFSNKSDGAGSEDTQPTPQLTDVTISGTLITLTFSDEDSVAWFDNTSARIDGDSVINVNNLNTHFVRAVAYNDYGTTWTQPFGIDTSYSVYYCQDTSENDNASNSNDGTDPDYPWATWNYAFQNANAGDSVYFREGTWYPGPTDIYGVDLNPSIGNGDSGLINNPIVFINYPGETPILDMSKNIPPGVSTTGVHITNAGYIELIGLTVRNVYSVPKDGQEVYTSDFSISNNTNVTLKNCIGHDGGGVGYYIYQNDTVILNNCDSYNHCDSLDLTGPGGDADGFIISTGDRGNWAITTMTGCRAWNNSDDGIDLGTYQQFYISNNWLFFNGILYDEGYQGDGTGLKTSGSMIQDVTQRRVHNNITAFNSPGGGVAELNLYSPAAPWIEFYNNTMYKDYMGYRSSVSGGDWDYETDSGSVVSANNLIYAPTRPPVGYSEYLTALGAYDPPYAYTTTTTDSWDWVDPQSHWYNRYNPAFTITDTDFTNLDSATIFSQLSSSRKSDGSLPDITVLKLTEGSDLINAGTDVGLSFNGSAPDIGAFESNYGGRTRKPALGSGGVVSVSSDGKILYFNNE